MPDIYGYILKNKNKKWHKMELNCLTCVDLVVSYTIISFHCQKVQILKKQKNKNHLHFTHSSLTDTDQQTATRLKTIRAK